MSSPVVFKTGTDQIVPIQKVIELLSKIITEGVFEVNKEEIDEENSKNTKEGYIKLISVDANQNLIIHLKLNGSAFDMFECNFQKKTYDIGVNTGELHKIVKIFNKDERLELFINSDDTSNLSLDVINKVEDTHGLYKLKLSDVDKKQLTLPRTAFDVIIKINTGVFSKIIQEMHAVGGENIEIVCTKNCVSFSTKGDSTQAKRECNAQNSPDSSKGVSISFSKKPETPNVIYGCYSLNYILMFSKCTNLCENIQIFMKNDWPILFKYTVATLGDLQFCLAPLLKNQVNRNFEDDDEFHKDEQVKFK